MTIEVSSTEVTVTNEGPQGPPGASGPATALAVAYNDTLTQLGASTVQGAIVALFDLVRAGQGGQLDFSNPLQSAWLGAGV